MVAVVEEEAADNMRIGEASSPAALPSLTVDRADSQNPKSAIVANQTVAPMDAAAYGLDCHSQPWSWDSRAEVVENRDIRAACPAAVAGPEGVAWHTFREEAFRTFDNSVDPFDMAEEDGMDGFDVDLVVVVVVAAAVTPEYEHASWRHDIVDTVGVVLRIVVVESVSFARYRATIVD